MCIPGFKKILPGYDEVMNVVGMEILIENH